MMYSVFVLLHLLFCFTNVESSNLNTSICPIMEGEIAPNISMFVRGSGGSKGVMILGDKNAEVYSISNGTVVFIGPRTNTVRIIEGDMTYEYFGMTPKVREGQKVFVGTSLGLTDIDFLLLSIKENGKKVDPRKYIKSNFIQLCQRLKNINLDTWKKNLILNDSRRKPLNA